MKLRTVRMIPIIYIYKSDDQSLVENYRPVAILSSTAKILETIISSTEFTILFDLGWFLSNTV